MRLARRRGDSSESGMPADRRQGMIGFDDLTPKSGTPFQGSSLDGLAQ
jgi:hypothetical protein